MPAKRTTTKKRAPSAAAATRAATVKAGARNGKRHEYEEEDYKKGTSRLSAGLAETVCGTILHATARGFHKAHREELEESPRNTNEFKRFAAKPCPPAVRRWVKENFMQGGDGFGAIESEIEIYVDELAVWMENALRYHKGHWCRPFCDCTVPPGCP